MCFRYIILICFVFSGIIFSQNNSESSTSVTVRLVNGTKFNLSSGKLNFNGISNSVQSELKTEPPDGISLRLMGSQIGDVIVSYSNSEIVNFYSDSQTNDEQQTPNHQLIFKPTVQTTQQSFEGRISNIANDTVLKLGEAGNESSTYLLIGGSLYLPVSLQEGFYTGTFTLSLIYR